MATFVEEMQEVVPDTVNGVIPKHLFRHWQDSILNVWGVEAKHLVAALLHVGPRLPLGVHLAAVGVRIVAAPHGDVGSDHKPFAVAGLDGLPQ